MNIKQYIKRGIQFIINGIPEHKTIANIVSIGTNELLKDRLAIITGGTSGIGYSIAEAFLRSGASVIITGRTEDKLCMSVNKLLKKGNYQGKVFSIVMDNTDVQSFKNKFNEIKIKVNQRPITILVNNAGILGGEISSISERDYDNILNTNLKGTFFLSKLFGEYLKSEHLRGNILNIASSSSLRPAASAYTLSKWGIRGLTLGLAKTLAPYGVTVNGLAPGPTATPMLIKEKTENIYLSSNPIARFALPEEIANMAVILTSDMGQTIIGDIIYMTGGAGLLTFDDVYYNF